MAFCYNPPSAAHIVLSPKEATQVELVFFTKSLKGMDIMATATEVKNLGFEGMDLAVRPGYCINPENVATELPTAVRLWADMGLSVPMVTTPTDFTDPRDPAAEPLLAACGEAGVREVKLGYWRYQEQGYWDDVVAIRGALDKFAQLAEKHGVRVAIHTHSGYFYGLNAASAMHLVQGMDPRHVGVYLDPGHLAINGEPIEIAVDMVRSYLCLVAMKDMAYIRTEREGRTVWGHTLVPFREGLVDWPGVLKALVRVGYDGPLSFHSEYHDVSLDELRSLTRDDLNYIRELLDRMEQAPA